MRQDDGSTFGRLLRAARIAAGFTQESLAEAAGLSIRGIQELERGLHQPYRDTVERLSRALALDHGDHARLAMAAGPRARGQAKRPNVDRAGQTIATSGEHPNAEPAVGTVQMATHPRHNLPLELTSFVGRRNEVARVRELLSSTRLLTLTGTGGCGKTRLALRVAAELADAFPHGVWLVELATVSDHRLVCQSISAALGIGEAPARPLLDSLRSEIGRKELLLLLDNCEHLVEECARVAEAMLQGCPGLRILATSREALRAAGESTYWVPSLRVPELGKPLSVDRALEFEGVQLFVERTRQVHPEFSITPATAPLVSELCSRLDGIPLALELAAARTEALSIEQIASRLDQRFRLLTQGRRTALLRQQTLRATIDWSYDLLSEPERVLLRRLAVFAGSFSAEAAERVCSDEGAASALGQEDVLGLLLRLVERSLVVVEADAREERYHMLETIRQYAWERLEQAGEVLALRGRHCDWCRRLVEPDESEWLGENQGPWLDLVEAHYSDVRAAMSFCLQSDPQAGLQLADSLGRYWSRRDYPSEGLRWLTDLLAKATDPTPLRGRALLSAGFAAWQVGDVDGARALAEESLAIRRKLSDAEGEGWALALVGRMAQLADGDCPRSISLLEEALGILRTVDDHKGVLWVLQQLGSVSWTAGYFDRATAYLEESLAMSRELNSPVAIGWSLGLLGGVARSAGDLPRARALLEETLAVFQGVGEKSGVAWTLGYLGHLATKEGDYGRAEKLLGESLVDNARLGLRLSAAWCLCFLGCLAIRQGDCARGVRLISAAKAIGGHLPASLDADERVEYEWGLTAARAALGDDPYERAWAAGQAQTLGEAIDCALRARG